MRTKEGRGWGEEQSEEEIGRGRKHVRPPPCATDDTEENEEKGRVSTRGPRKRYEGRNAGRGGGMPSMHRAARTRIKLAYALFLAGALLGVIAGASDASEHARAIAGAIALLLLISGLMLGFRGRGQPPGGDFWGGGPPGGGHHGGGGGHGGGGH